MDVNGGTLRGWTARATSAAALLPTASFQTGQGKSLVLWKHPSFMVANELKQRRFIQLRDDVAQLLVAGTAFSKSDAVAYRSVPISVLPRRGAFGLCG
jgi:hypothetical protein